MYSIHALSRYFAAATAGLLSVSLVLALVGGHPKGDPPVPVTVPLNDNAKPVEVIPLFPTTEPAENPSVLILQTDERSVHGWVAGKKSFAGERVHVSFEGVTVRDDNTFTLTTGLSDGQGQVGVRIPVGDGTSLVARTILPKAPASSSTIFFVTDRSAYRPGHTLKFVGFLRTLQRNGEFTPIRNQRVTVELTSATRHTRAAVLALTADSFGRITGEYTFSDHDALDHYVLTSQGFAGSAQVVLSEYRKSKVNLQLSGVVKDGKLSITFNARDYLNRPMKGTAASYVATVIRTAEPEKLSLNPAEFAKSEGHPPTSEDFDALPDDERLFTLANGVSAMTFAGFGSRVVGSREGTVTVPAEGNAKVDLDLRPEWLKGKHAIAISGVFTDETGRENRAAGTFKLEPLTSRGVRVSIPNELVAAGERIPVTLVPFGLGVNDKPTTTLIVVKLETQPAPPGTMTNPESEGNPDSTRLPSLAGSKPKDKAGKPPMIEGWSNVPVIDPVKRVIKEVVPAVGDTAVVTLTQPGAYKLLAVTRLRDGTTVESETGLVVKTPAKLPGLVLQLDRREFDAGSRLTGTIHTRFSGAKLLLTLRDSTGIKMMKTLTSGANGVARIDEPLPAMLRYGCAVSVQYPESATMIHADQRDLFVMPSDRTIQVTTTVPAEAGPGSDVNLGIQIDRKEETDLIVSVFDESLLAVSGDLSKDVRNFYLADARGQGRAARELAATRLGGIAVSDLVKKAERLLEDKAAVAHEPGLLERLKGLVSRWNQGKLEIPDVVALVRLAGLEVFLTDPIHYVYGPTWQVSKQATLADLLRGEQREVNEQWSPVTRTSISASVVGNVALIGIASRIGATQGEAPDPWIGYSQGTPFPRQGYGIGLAYGQSAPPGTFQYYGGVFYGQWGMGNMRGMMGIGGIGGLSGGIGGIGGINGGIGGIGGGSPGFFPYLPPGGQMGMPVGIAPPLPALGLADDVIRTDFADSAFWSAKLRTDANGKATATFKLPDSLTNWRVSVTAVSAKMHVGTGSAKIKSTRSVMVWPMLPRTFTEGDVVRVFGTVHNLTDKEQSIQVRLTAENGQVLDDAERTVKVPAKGNVPVYWTYKAGTKGFTDLLMSAKGDAGSDASSKKLPITPAGILERATVSGVVGKGELKITLPDDFDPARATATVTVAPTLAADLADTLPYLVDYPYGCVEQTMSRFLPAIRVAQILQQCGVSKMKDLEAKLPGVVAAGQKRLIELQQPDGGWAWQGTGSTHELMTPYALFGLIQAEEAGYRCPNPTTIGRGLTRLKGYLEQMAPAWDQITDRRVRSGEINDSLFCLWVYASRAGNDDLSRWWTRIERNVGESWISDYGHALALELAAKNGKRELAGKLAAELHKRARTQADRVYWTTAGFSRWGDNPIEVTAAVMKALVAHNAVDPLIPGILAFFHGTKRGDRWDSTKDTACVLYALCDYLAAVKAGPAAAGLVKVSVNGTDDGNVRLDSPESKVVKLTGKTLKPGENVVTITGSDANGGSLVHVVVSFTRSRGAEIPAREYGVKVTRTVSLRGADGKWTELKSGATVHSGSYLKVRVSAAPTPGTTLQYTLLESPKPAGGETVPVDDSRFPTPGDAMGHVLREDREAMTCFHYENAPGTAAAEYMVLTEFAGEFHLAPARVELMYKPTVGGHSDSFMLKVSEKK